MTTESPVAPMTSTSPEPPQISWRQAVHLVKKLKLSDDYILLVKHGTPIANRAALQVLSQAIEKAGFKRVVICVVDEFEHLTSLTTGEMNRVGWFHSDQIRGWSDKRKKGEL